MSRTTYIIGSLAGSMVIAYVCDKVISDDKLFGDKCGTPGTVSNKAWGAATEERLQAWPRTVGPPVVTNPISHQNFIVKSRSD